ncbi:MAG: hypothetical protein PHI31_02755 [Desulfuromonadaceae bacterium]|nr:hypothetical protein [Desulfuromonadaceae bacterium]
MDEVAGGLFEIVSRVGYVVEAGQNFAGYAGAMYIVDCSCLYPPPLQRGIEGDLLLKYFGYWGKAERDGVLKFEREGG